MSRYTNVDALIEKCYKQMDELMESTSEHLSAEALSLLCGFTLINSAPSIDLVRCKECKFENTRKCPPHRMGLIHEADDFCSYGEREGER